jgi:hypothetical protein
VRAFGSSTACRNYRVEQGILNIDILILMTLYVWIFNCGRKEFSRRKPLFPFFKIIVVLRDAI